MAYLIIGNKSIQDKEKQNLYKKLNINSNDVIKYDLLDAPISRIIEELDTFSLFEDKKIVLCNNFSKLDNNEIFLKYLENESDNILILTDEKKLEGNSKIVKAINQKLNIIDNSDMNLLSLIKEEFKDYEIYNMTAIMLQDYCNNDYGRVINEIEKLKMFKLDDKKITNEDVKLLVKKSFDSTIFDLINAINKKNKTKIFEIYNELINNNEDETKIIATLANHYRLVYKIKILTEDNLDEDIIKELKLHPYRFKLLKEQSYSYSKTDLLTIIKNMSVVDINVKSGVLDKKIAMELFLAHI